MAQNDFDAIASTFQPFVMCSMFRTPKMTTVYWIATLVAGIYMLGIGFQFLPDPGKKGSEKNRDHFDKYRSVFKVSGILAIAYLALSLVSSALEA
jgi:hypothetical protein